MGRGRRSDQPNERARNRGAAGRKSQIDDLIDSVMEPRLLPVSSGSRGQRHAIWDVDSTIFPLLDAMGRQAGGENVKMENCHTWDTLPDMCGGVDEMLKLFDAAMSFQGMRDVGTFPGVAAASRCMRRHGIAVHCATDRPEALASDTEMFLRESGIQFESLHCAPGVDKVQLCKEIGAPVLVDDRPQALTSARESGIASFALRFPYNESVLEQFGIADAGEDWLALSERVLATIGDLESAEAVLEE